MARPISARVERIYTEFYAEKAETRFAFLLDRANRFCDGLALPEGYVAHVSRLKMEAMVQSYFLDVIKFKDYHFDPSKKRSDDADVALPDVFSREFSELIHSTKHIAPSKVAAFSTKWLMKHCPISVLVPSDAIVDADTEKKINSANAVFAMTTALKFMRVPMVRVDTERLEKLVYYLMYRNVDERSLFEWFENLADGKSLPRETE